VLVVVVPDVRVKFPLPPVVVNVIGLYPPVVPPNENGTVFGIVGIYSL